MGELEDLETADKTSIVSAINEVFQLGTNRKQELVDILVAKGADCSTNDSWEDLLAEVENLGTSLPKEGFTFESIEGVQYPFTRVNGGDFDGWYKNSNQGVHNSFSISRIHINNPQGKYIIIDYYQDSESSYDFGMIGNVDTQLERASSADHSSKLLVNVKGYNGWTEVHVGKVTSGYIEVKYKKDGSDNSGTDTFMVNPYFRSY